MPDDGFRPAIGDRVRIVGNCHPRIYGVVADVVMVENTGCTLRYPDPDSNQEVFGILGMWGGLLPADTPWQPDGRA